MKSQKSTIEKYMYAINEIYMRKDEFLTKTDFARKWRLSHGVTQVMEKLDLIRKNDYRVYVITKKVNRSEVDSLLSQIRNNAKLNKRVENQTTFDYKPLDIKLPKMESVIQERHSQTIEETSGGWSILWGLVKVNPKKTTRVTD
jgi:hypothetical protein